MVSEKALQNYKKFNRLPHQFLMPGRFFIRLFSRFS